MTKVHGKRYAYKFDFQGLAAATQPTATDPAYKYQSDLFMTPYHHGTKLTSFMNPHHGITTSSCKWIPPNLLENRIDLRSQKNDKFYLFVDKRSKIYDFSLRFCSQFQ